MARSIVLMHSGRLWAENNPDGKGTTFRFSLPAVLRESPQSAAVQYSNECTAVAPAEGWNDALKQITTQAAQDLNEAMK